MKLLRTILLLPLAALIVPQLASSVTREAFWTTYRIETTDSKEAKVAQKIVASLASEWRLQSVEPVSTSDIEDAYKKGEAPFEGTFYITVDIRSNAVLVEVAVDPQTDSDHDNFHLLRAQLERKLTSHFSGRLRSITVSRGQSE
jgi:hypothetical protein